LIHRFAQGLAIDALEARRNHTDAADRARTRGQFGSGAGGGFGLDLLQLALKLALALKHLLQLVEQLGLAATEQCRDLDESLLLLRNVGHCCSTGNRFDAAHARSDTAFGQDFEQPDIAGATHVGSAAQLGRECTHAQHPYPLAVFFAEQGHGTEIERLLHVHLMHFGLGVATDLRIDQGFDLRQLRAAHRLEMGKVEAQPLRRHQRAFLADMLAQYLAQRGMQQMGGRMVGHHRLPALAIHRCRKRVADRQRARIQGTDMAVKLVGELVGIADHEALSRTPGQHTGIAHLPAGLGVERGLVEHHDGALTGTDARHRAAIDHQRQHFASVSGKALIPAEPGRRQRAKQLPG